MLVRSLALRTEIMFAELDGDVLDRGDHVVVRTPSNPTFFWGNFLVLPVAPTVAALEVDGELMRLFEEQFPSTRHRLFAWDDIAAGGFDPTPFAGVGFRSDNETSLLRLEDIDALRSPRQSMTIRATRQDEWPSVFALLDRCMTPMERAALYREFLRLQVARYARFVEAGHGDWFGVFDDDTLVGTCGVFSRAGLTRYQVVCVDEAWRGRGVAMALVAHVASFALQRWNVPVLIGAAPGSQAERIYSRLGFAPIERTTALLKRHEAVVAR
jgi:GNAT superfamily N-acetyltransferase